MSRWAQHRCHNTDGMGSGGAKGRSMNLNYKVSKGKQYIYIAPFTQTFTHSAPAFNLTANVYTVKKVK